MPHNGWLPLTVQAPAPVKSTRHGATLGPERPSVLRKPHAVSKPMQKMAPSSVNGWRLRNNVSACTNTACAVSYLIFKQMTIAVDT